MFRSLLLLSLGFLFLNFADPARAEKRVALVIGISNYQQVPRLNNPAHDANALTGLFKKAGFDVVEEEHDLGIANLRRAIRDFTEKSRDADIAVVYYAGHGIDVEITQQSRICGNEIVRAIDLNAVTSVVNHSDVEDETVSLDRVLRALDPV